MESQKKMNANAPWYIGSDDAMPHTCNMQIISTTEEGDRFVLAAFNYNFPDISVDAAARAVVCRNALQGIADPEAFVARAKRIEDAARDLIGCWQDDISPLTNPIERLITALETNP